MEEAAAVVEAEFVADAAAEPAALPWSPCPTTSEPLSSAGDEPVGTSYQEDPPWH